MSVFNILFSIKNKNRNNKVRGWEGGVGVGGEGGGVVSFSKMQMFARGESLLCKHVLTRGERGLKKV